MKIDNRLYEAKDLKRILGLTPETIYLWLGTYRIFEPALRAPGVRGKNKYSLLDVVKLALILNLQNIGIHLSHIRGIFAGLDKDENGINLWERILNERERFDRVGATLIIRRLSVYRIDLGPMGINKTRLHGREPNYQVRLLSYKEAAGELSFNVKAPLPRLIIPIKWIIEAVELRTRERLGQRKDEIIKES